MRRLSWCVGVWLPLAAVVPLMAGGCDRDDAAKAGSETPPAGKAVADKDAADKTVASNNATPKAGASKGVPSDDAPGNAAAGNGDASGKPAEASVSAKQGLSQSDAGEGSGDVTDTDMLTTLDKRVARVAKLAREIEKAPESADSILDAADLSRADLDGLIYTIATDPKLAKQYQLALADK